MTKHGCGRTSNGGVDSAVEFLPGRFSAKYPLAPIKDESTETRNSDILPPHCGQTKLMIDEMICAFNAPGSVSAVLIIARLFRDPTTARGADTSHKHGNCPARVFYALGRPELVGCGVGLGRIGCRLA
jgi:hypothetical protein